MVNTTYPKPVREWMGRTIRTEVPRTATTHAPNVANTTSGINTYHLTRGGIPSPNNQEHPEAQAKYPPGVSPIPSKR
uniref:Uncharacterized protein n=1 Tax=Siphoviridae sp. ctu1h4 TaxID=2826499 RepID=A0A8S5MVV9_9CAUD|nr:MAG TPA: hypothetical protein [Siphoviridae sp. ctu1h4]